MRYRWSRTLAERGWKTTMTLVSSAPDTVQTEKGPQVVSRKIPVSRIEIGDPQTPTRVFDTDGRMVFLLPAQARPASRSAGAAAPAGGTNNDAALSIEDGIAAALTMPDATAAAEPSETALRSRDWVEQLMPTRAAGAARRASLVRALGHPHGIERGLERFVGQTGDETTEILSDPAWGVPLEINVVRDGTLRSHTTFGYVEDPGAGLVRRRLRSEQLLSPESGARSVVDIELANIRLDRGGAR
jgi:hypothetical protein